MTLSPKVLIAGLLVVATTQSLAYPRHGFGRATNGNLSAGSQNLVLELSGAPAAGGYSLSQDEADTGTTIRHPIVTGSAIPFASRWDDLTDAQKASLRAHYDGLPADREPPFPVGGLYSIYRPISDIVNRLANRSGRQSLGPMTLGVVVEPDGQVATVNVYAGRVPGVTGAIIDGLPRAHLDGLSQVRFKPGLCQG